MCMKNLNSVITVCAEINNFENGTQNLIGLFDTIVANKENGTYSLENLCVVINSVVIFNNDDLKDEMKLDTDYEFLVRLTYVSTGESVDLGKFNLNLHKSQLTTWCKDFYEFKYTIKIPYVFLPNGVGSYALKLLVREENASKWTVQSISKIVVKDGI